MVQEFSLKEIERKAFTSTFQDGILDMYLGLFLVAMGVSPILEKIIPTSDLWIAILMVPIIPLWWVGKKLVTVPRMGLVTFGASRKGKLKKIRTVYSFFLLLGVVVFLLFSYTFIPQSLPGGSVIPTLAWIVLFLTGFCVSAYHLDLERLYLYGMLFAIPFPIHIMLRHDMTLGRFSLFGFFLSGIVILLVGTILFIRFLRKYPLPKEASSVSQ